MTNLGQDVEVTDDPNPPMKRLTGAYRTSWGNRWFSNITIKGVRINLGTFASPEEAHQAYLTARRTANGPRSG